MDRHQRRGLTALLLVAAVLAVPVVGAAGTGQAQPEADNTVTRIQVYENGTARWSIQVRTRLETEADVDRFRAFQERLRTNRSDALARFEGRMTGVVAAAAEATGRPMTARGFALSTHVQELPLRWGVVTYAFTWTAFARADGDALVVGDVFQGGFFLAENDRLIVAQPADYRILAAEPAADATLDDAVAWDGRRDFADGRPRVRLAPAAAGDPTASPPGGDGPEPGGLPTATLAAVAVAGLLALAGAGLFVRRRRAGAAGAPVTDAERIRRLLAEHGGQLKQAEIDEAVEWSASKTSRVLSGMAEAGTVEKLRIGRENVIRLREDGPGED